MNPKKYMLHYDWRENRNGQFMFYGHYETDSFVLALIKFVRLRFRYSTKGPCERRRTMSELKADNTFVFGEECLAYKKSEADKVIAEKDKQIAELKADIADLRDDKKSTDALLDERNAEVAELHADYKEACDRLLIYAKTAL